MNETNEMTEIYCPKHPYYKGIRRPTADCAICRNIYEFNVRTRSFAEAVAAGDLQKAMSIIVEMPAYNPSFVFPMRNKRVKRNKRKKQEDS
jgi:hypothetical protein